MRTPVVLLLTILFMAPGCSPRREKIPPVPEMKASKSKVVVYQMVTRLFGNTTSMNKPFGTIVENGVGKFNDITPRALQGIKELGVTHIWYTGVIEHALITDYSVYGIPADDPDVIKGRAGSPYSIKDYYDVSPDLAVNVNERMREFESLVERTHLENLKVIIDFIPNHVWRGYHSDAKPATVEDLGASDDLSKAFLASNNFYYLPGTSFEPPADHFRRLRQVFPGMDGRFEEKPAKATGNDIFSPKPPADSWFETAKLNYGVDFGNGRKTYFDPVPNTWLKMKDILVFWAGKKVDGFRCDMAEMVPVEFWNWVIPQVKAVNPEIVFIAEIYQPKRYLDFVEKGRFDFLYDKVQLYDTLRLLITGKASATDIPSIQESLEPLRDRMLHFLENHDEQRIASPWFAGDAWRALPGMVVSATIDPGPVMIYFGQEVGEPGAGAEGFNGDDGRTTHFDYWGVPEHQKWMNNGVFDGGGLSPEQKTLRSMYSKILKAASEEPAVANGDYRDLTVMNVTAGTCSNRIVSFARTAGESRLIVIAGFNPRPERVQIKLTPDLAFSWGLGEADKFDVEDMLGDTTVTSLSGKEGLMMMLPAFGTRIYKVGRK